MVGKLHQTPVTDAEKREALAAVLASETFARSAQMRLFVSYVCEREMAGELEELTEYQIAINVLGRPKNFNLTDDSAVRNRAYELRHRLEKFYSSEQPHSALEIHIPRGGYVPNYLRPAQADPETKAVLAVASLAPSIQKAEDPAGRAEPTRTGLSLRLRISALVLGAFLLIAGLGIGFYLGRPHPPGILKEAWGPLVSPGDDLRICIATNLHLIVRQHLRDDTAMRYLAPPEIAGIWGNVRRPMEPSVPLYMAPAQLSVPLAEVEAATTVCRVRQTFGGACQLLPESESPIASLRGRNAVLIGSNTNSSAAALLLKGFPYAIDYTANDRFAVIDRREAPDRMAVYVVEPTGDPVASEHYGLLTVISSAEISGSVRRTLVLSGSSSAGVQAVAEFFSSPSHLRLLLERFQKEGWSGFPANYQVLVKCRTAGVRLVAYEFLADAALK